MGMVKDMGLWGVGIPEELGGAGLGTLGTCLVEEELSQTVVPFDLGDVTPLLFDCSEQQKETYFKAALNRQRLPYLALMEPAKEASELENLALVAEKSNGSYVISGKKMSLSRPGEDYFAIVFATSSVEGPLRERVSCFLVDKGSPGFSVAGEEGDNRLGGEREKAPFSGFRPLQGGSGEHDSARRERPSNLARSGFPQGEL